MKMFLRVISSNTIYFSFFSDLGKADEITVVREEVVMEPTPKKSKTKKKSNFFIKTFRSIKKKLYN